MRILPYRTIQNVIDGVVITFEDITEQIQIKNERKNADFLLHKTAQRFKLALKNLPIIVADIDLKLRYTWIHNFQTDFAYKEVIGKRDDEIDQSEGTLQLMQMKKQVIETGKVERKIITFLLPDKNRTYDIAIQPVFDSDGEIIGATSAAFDITEQESTRQIQAPT